MSPTSNEANEVTAWLSGLQEGDDTAIEHLWTHCFPRMVRYSRSRLPANLRRAFDEEDVALSAFKSFCKAAEAGKADEIADREELWKLLTCITARKASGYIRREKTQKRGGGKVRGESIFLQKGNSQSRFAGGIENIAKDSEAAGNSEDVADVAIGFIEDLQDEHVRAVALLRLEGFTVEEIAERMECGKRTVERRLRLIRKTWLETKERSQE